MKRRLFGKSILALTLAVALVAGVLVVFNEPADALVMTAPPLVEQPTSSLVHEVDCPNLPICSSTAYLRIYGWCDEPESCTMYRYPSSSTPHCMVCN